MSIWRWASGFLSSHQILVVRRPDGSISTATANLRFPTLPFTVQVLKG